ncbi:hypothetical protein O1611_g8677 [Lasiodiplodia mahajangana]|uniref:Uncharacterized protein n=1 Tax=Lasiodiplodia mahajangana TaxID=1108764 RepID=A0ACC2JCP5_9PEZI|nr:hypothetical protein O1611_g8677 [Lasiodiplodia mahajangana]
MDTSTYKAYLDPEAVTGIGRPKKRNNEVIPPSPLLLPPKQPKQYLLRGEFLLVSAFVEKPYPTSDNNTKMSYPDSNNNQLLLEYPAVPELEIPLSGQYEYRVEFRHLNCVRSCKPTPAREKEIRSGLESFRDYGAFITTDCVWSVPMELSSSQFLHVCPGACHQSDNHGFEDSIAARLSDLAQAFYRLAHPCHTGSIEIVGVRINWLPGIPAYLTSEGTTRPHSSAITGGHLGLIQTRGGKLDKIQIDFISSESTYKHCIQESLHKAFSDVSDVWQNLGSKLPANSISEQLRTITAGPYGRGLIQAILGTLIVILSSHITLGT